MKALCAIVIALLASTDAAASLRSDGPLPMRILYDNSGSMHPGYRPPGAAGRRTRAELSVHFFHQLPEFEPWLDDFVRRQTDIGGDTVGMWTFTSRDAFAESDIVPVHPVVPIREFHASSAVANFPPRAGSHTYLTETLTAFSRDFTGLVWLITDNIVEANAGEPDAGVQRFFETLAQSSEFRSVHLFKHTFEENGHSSALAVYGILISAEEVPVETLARYDGKFEDLFPGREHLKLKNLSIRPLTLRADLQLVLSDREKGMFREGQSVELDLDGEIQSHLTQHAVTAGRYELAIASPFVAEPWAQRDLGARPLAAEIFAPFNGEIDNEIPPKGARRIHAMLQSSEPVSFSPSGIAEWVRLAWSGATVRYTGAVRMSLTDVRVRLQRQQMAGIFGIDHASSIFAFQDVTSLTGIRPSVVPVSFALRTGSSRSAILLAILAVLGVLITVAALVSSRKRTYRISITTAPDTLTALRPLGTHNVVHEGKVLGRLSRGLLSSYAFHAARANPEFTVMPASDGETWDIKFTSGSNRRLSIQAEGGKKPTRPKPSSSSVRAVPPPPPPSLKNVVPPRPPKVGR
ncbi:MAG TPA: hypothetical protein VEK79_14080 [Thermoanaerobaculia bacterium]|nr:hypothetical protein [Thermoanaerobaculia bacterium]